MLISDHFFTGGIGHPICEDYALSGSYTVDGEVYHYGIVSDGCTSAPDTDIGCRILSVIAKQIISAVFTDEAVLKRKAHDFLTSMGNDIIQRSHINTKALGIGVESLSATLLFVVWKEGGYSAYAVAFGDGFVYGIKDGVLDLHRISYPTEAPYYLNYSLIPKWQKLYLEQHGAERVESYGSYSLDDGKLISKLFTHKCSILDPCVFVLDGYDYVGVASDGFDQVREVLENGQRNPLTSDQVIREATNIKNFNGSFVSRHLGFLLKRKWKDRELFDDISTAMIANIEEEND